MGKWQYFTELCVKFITDAYVSDKNVAIVPTLFFSYLCQYLEKNDMFSMEVIKLSEMTTCTRAAVAVLLLTSSFILALLCSSVPCPLSEESGRS